ncbi:sialate O-acetylesterase [Halosquirtibacter laminarini]|uniref:Sialate O-acetylesterase n=1 Tax=Halosquirtibacter laminarini TaxID=3374600 RepID=A0AC61NM05_9BACT|nr:sialate O-acetylesterase [Prolixibacteraceae bacterium]
MKRLILAFIIMFAFNTSFANKLKTPQVLGSHMVLQRDTLVKIWGWGKPNKKITLTSSWNKKHYTSEVGEDGKWLFEIETTSAGGPYNITIQSAKEKIVYEDILMGEVWLFSGQSNMFFKLEGKYGSYTYRRQEVLKRANNPQIRIFDVDNIASLTPSDTLLSKEQWQVSTPNTAAKTSAIAYMFALQLQETLNVPIGVIHSSFGGSYISSWISKENLAKYDNIKTDNLKFTRWNNDVPTALYNAMIRPLTPYTIQGMLWYQGESDRHKPKQYISLFKDLAAQWRKEFDCNFSIFLAQIAPFGYKNDSESQYIRESQVTISQTIEKSGVVITSDVGEKGNIHPHEKGPISDRFVNLALHRVYNMTAIDDQGPTYKNATTKKGRMILEFTHCNEGMVCKNGKLTNFTIAGKDKKFYPAEAKIIGWNKIAVSSDKVKRPVAVRYGWSNFFKGDIYDANKLPLSSFRTDQWDTYKDKKESK